MDLKSFVAESLSQILAGIKQAQSGPLGENVAAEGYISGQGNFLSGGTSGFFTLVDFDISVIASTTEGGGNIRVASLEVIEDAARRSQNTSRVKFSVHVRIPTGGRLIESGHHHGSGVMDHDFDV